MIRQGPGAAALTSNSPLGGGLPVTLLPIHPSAWPALKNNVTYAPKPIRKPGGARAVLISEYGPKLESKKSAARRARKHAKTMIVRDWKKRQKLKGQYDIILRDNPVHVFDFSPVMREISRHIPRNQLRFDKTSPNIRRGLRHRAKYLSRVQEQAARSGLPSRELISEAMSECSQAGLEDLWDICLMASMYHDMERQKKAAVEDYQVMHNKYKACYAALMEADKTIAQLRKQTDKLRHRNKERRFYR